MQLLTALEPVTPPAAEPVSVAEARLHLRIDTFDDDAWLNTSISAARRAYETLAERSLIHQTLRYRLSRFPADGDDGTDEALAIVLPIARLSSVTSITYVDPAGATQTLPGSDYLVDASGQPGRVTPAYGKAWPACREQPGSVSVTFVAGDGASASDVDPRDKQAVLMLVGHWYRNREAVIVGTISKHLEFTLRALAAQRWHGSLG
ncbi:MAG: head-tail connector protein [Phycisphaerales bacterium]